MQFRQLLITVFFVTAIASSCFAAGPAEPGFKKQNSEPALAQETMGRIEKMLPVFDSIIRSTPEQKSIPTEKFLSTNQELTWDILYHLCVNFGEQYPQIEIQEDKMKVPYKAMQEFATACFADYEDLAAVPAGVEHINYSKEWNAFMLAMSDRGATTCGIAGVEPEGDEKFKVKVNLTDDETGEVLDAREFIIVPNAFASGTTDPAFFFSVAEVKEAR